MGQSPPNEKDYYISPYELLERMVIKSKADTIRREYGYSEWDRDSLGRTDMKRLKRAAIKAGANRATTPGASDEVDALSADDAGAAMATHDEVDAQGIKVKAHTQADGRSNESMLHLDV